MKNFQAVIASRDTNETYIMFIEAEGENFADKEVYEVFDAMFSQAHVDPKDGYRHTVQEIENFPKLPEGTVWTTSIFGRKHTIFKKIN